MHDRSSGVWFIAAVAAFLLASCGGHSSNQVAAGDDDNDDNDDNDNDDDLSPADDDDDASPVSARYWIYDEQNRVRIFHGAEIIREAPPYLSWHTKADYARLLDWGLNAVRLGVEWQAVEPQQGVFDEDFLMQLDERIAWCRELGISVFLEIHQDLYGPKYDGNGAPDWACIDHGIPFKPWTPWYLNYLQPAVVAAFTSLWANTQNVQDYFVMMWAELAARYADESAVVGYDLINEPSPGMYALSFDQSALTPFYQRLIGAMEDNGLNHVFFAEPSGAVGAGLRCEMTDLGLPNVGYAPHFYPVMPTLFNAYVGGPATLEPLLANIERTAAAMKAPVWIGEWALFNPDAVNRDAYMTDATAVFDEHLASWSYWIYDKDDRMGLLESNGDERAWVLDKLSRPYPQRVAGWPTSYSFDFDTKHFTLSWTENPAAQGPTVVFVPASRHYPNGFTVSGSDPDGAWSYQWDAATQRLSISADRGVNAHAIQLEAKGRPRQRMSMR